MVSPEAFAHVDHASLALAEATLQLLALGGEGVDQGRGEAFDGGVAVDEDAVAVLEAVGECRAWRDQYSQVDGGFAGITGNWNLGNLRISLQDEGMLLIW